MHIKNALQQPRIITVVKEPFSDVNVRQPHNPVRRLAEIGGPGQTGRENRRVRRVQNLGLHRNMNRSFRRNHVQTHQLSDPLLPRPTRTRKIQRHIRFGDLPARILDDAARRGAKNLIRARQHEPMSSRTLVLDPDEHFDRKQRQIRRPRPPSTSPFTIPDLRFASGVNGNVPRQQVVCGVQEAGMMVLGQAQVVAVQGGRS